MDRKRCRPSLEFPLERSTAGWPRVVAAGQPTWVPVERVSVR